jgi:hypothetical protein
MELIADKQITYRDENFPFLELISITMNAATGPGHTRHDSDELGVHSCP